MSAASSLAAPLIRDAVLADMAQVQALYAHYVQHGRATFEELVPDVAEMSKRHQAIVSAGMPYLVAAQQSQVIGFAYASTYRTRAAYRYTVENSVYVAPGLAQSGIGSRLLAALIERCEAGPWRQMVAVIGGSDNLGSIALHRKFGFELIGTMPGVGHKLGTWVDTVLMQRALGPGDSTPPGV